MFSLIIMLIITLLSFPFALAQECITPDNGLVIDASAQLCSGVHNLTAGLYVYGIGKPVTLDCADATLQGAYMGRGITARGTVTLQNCELKTFEQAIVLEHAELTLENVRLVRNALAIGGSGAFADKGIVFDENLQDVLLQPLPEFLPEPRPSVPYPSIAPAQLAAQLQLSAWEISEVYKGVGFIPLERIDTPTSTTLRYGVVAKAPIKQLALYVAFPKAVVESTALLRSEPPFEVIEEDPTIRIRLGDLKEGEKRSVTIVIDKNLPIEFTPTTLLQAEYVINTRRSLAMRMLFVFTAFILGIILLGPRRFLQRRKKILLQRLHGARLSQEGIRTRLRRMGWPPKEIERMLHHLRRHPAGHFTDHWPWISFAAYVIIFLLLDLRFEILIDQFWVLAALAALNIGLLAWLVRILALLRYCPEE